VVLSGRLPTLDSRAWSRWARVSARFNEGSFSEENVFLLSEWMAHTSTEILDKNFNLERSMLANLPKRELFIFPAELPRSLAEDKSAVGGSQTRLHVQYTFKMVAMDQTKRVPGGGLRELPCIDTR
jgi:oxalate decarboxylase